MDISGIKIDNIQNVVREIWNSVLGLNLSFTASPAVAGGGIYTSWVRIIGSDNLTVLIQCSEGLARTSTANMFGVAESEVTEDQMKDSLKEMVNIIGGNIKGTMTKYHFLSLPSVSDLNKDPHFPNADLICEFNFKYLDQSLRLSVLRVD